MGVGFSVCHRTAPIFRKIQGKEVIARIGIFFNFFNLFRFKEVEGVKDVSLLKVLVTFS